MGTQGLENAKKVAYAEYDFAKDGGDKGNIELLAYSEEAGYLIFESTDGKFLVYLGHPEYNTERLVEEYIRDRNKGRFDVVRPKNLDINKPINRWRGQCMEFYSQWIKYVYETTPF